MKDVSAVTTPNNLPHNGMSRFNQIKPFLPVSRETYRKMVRAGKAPQPIHLFLTCVMYQNSDLHAFLADPVNYRAEVAA